MIDDIDMAVEAPPVRAPSRRGALFLKTMLWMIAALAAIGVCTAAAVALMGSDMRLGTLQSWLWRIKPYACVIHLALIGWLWWKWDALMATLYATGRMHPSMKQAVLASRNRTVMMLLAVEVFVVMEFPFSLMRMMQ